MQTVVCVCVRSLYRVGSSGWVEVAVPPSRRHLPVFASFPPPLHGDGFNGGGFQSMFFTGYHY